MKPFRGRRSQLGHAPFAEGLFKLVFWAIGIFVALTVLVPTWFAISRRSFALGSIAAAIAIVWAYLFITKIVIPGNASRERTNWLLAGLRECEEQLKALPSEFRAEGVLDSAGVIRADWILPMLTDRKLRFIEVRGSSTGPIRIARRPDHTNADEQWTWDHAPSPWVRIRLASEEEAVCATVPKRLQEALHRPPLMAKTCLTLEAIQEPSAPLEVRLMQSSNERARTYGRWALVDRVADKSLAELTTTDTLEDIRTTGRLRARGEGRATDGSHTPAQALFERVWGSDERLQSGQVFAQRDVQPDKEPMDLVAHAEPLPVMRAEGSIRPVSDAEMRQLRWPDWGLALENAGQSGTAGFNDLHIDLRSRQLTRLQLDRGTSGMRWQVLADFSGFFVYEQYTESLADARRLLIHYDPQGRLQRAVLVDIDAGTPWRSGSVGVIRFEGKDVVIDGTATGTASNGGSTTAWQVESIRIRGFN